MRTGMKIEPASSSEWRYSNRDITAGQSYVSLTRPRTWTVGAIDAQLDIRTQYLSSGSWYRTNGDDQTCRTYKSYIDQTVPSFYHCHYVTEILSSDTQWAHTHDHD